MDKVKEKVRNLVRSAGRGHSSKSYIDLERMAQMTEETLVSHGLSKMVRVERGLAPATGFERSEPTHGSGDNADFLTSIASARQEAQTMFELSQDLGVSLSLSETLSVLSMRLRRMIPYDSIAVFVNRNGWLLPELVSGENFRMLVVAENSRGRRTVRLGGGKLQADRERQSAGGSGIHRRPGKAHDAAIGAGRASRRPERRGRRAGDVSRQSRCFHAGSPANSAGGSIEGRAVGGERAEVSAGGELGDNGLSDWPAECALVVRAPGAGSGTLPAHEDVAGGAGLRHRRLQADQRLVRTPGRRQTAARVYVRA